MYRFVLKIPTIISTSIYILLYIHSAFILWKSMFVWAHWSTQKYQHQNIINVQQATCNLEKNQFFYQSVSQSIYPTGTLNNYTTTQQYYSQKTPVTPYFSTPHEQRKTDITMDVKDYYKFTRFNDYSVHFPNRSALPIDEVENICSKFGEINTCKQTGDECGLCFINYKTEDGARNCVEGLKNHPKIKLRLVKHYNEKKTNNRESKKYDYPSSSFGCNNSSENKENYNQSYKENNNCNQGLEKGCNSVKENGSTKIVKDIQPAMCENIDGSNSRISVNNVDNVNDVELTATEKSQSIVEDKTAAPTVEMPTLITAPTKNISKCDIAKELINTTMTALKKPAEIIEAQEIIVANIEDHYGVPAILHLLEKYEPICASPIKVCKRHSVRYCHVYFNDVHQAQAAERDFDEYEWSANQKLIVMRINTLATLASLL